MVLNLALPVAHFTVIGDGGVVIIVVTVVVVVIARGPCCDFVQLVQQPAYLLEPLPYEGTQDLLGARPSHQLMVLRHPLEGQLGGYMPGRNAIHKSVPLILIDSWVVLWPIVLQIHGQLVHHGSLLRSRSLFDVCYGNVEGHVIVTIIEEHISLDIRHYLQRLCRAVRDSFHARVGLKQLVFRRVGGRLALEPHDLLFEQLHVFVPPVENQHGHGRRREPHYAEEASPKQWCLIFRGLHASHRCHQAKKPTHHHQ
mmetsp:Transcript_34578/g.55644  ORF Transcript_34578/g.55644 Transcript_34578/m.55644 type:complete len:255 (+) Transcript_34578:204-968(+)